MIFVTMVVVSLVLWGVVLRPAAVEMSRFERLFVWLSPIPVLITFIVPVMLVLTGWSVAGRAPWADEVTGAGLACSGILLVVALVISCRRFSRGSPLGIAVTAGTALAGFPLLLTGLVGLLWVLL
jgi:hypothetical protein